MAITVVLADGEEASGMAYMLGGLLEENLRDFRSRARVARLLRGPVVLTASDRDVSVTVEFRAGAVELRDGIEPGAAVIAGPWLTMTKLCSGQRSPLEALRSGEVSITNYRRAPVAAGAGFVLSVPVSFYGDAAAGTEVGSEHRRTKVAVAVGGAVLVAAVLWVVLRRRRSRIGPRQSATRARSGPASPTGCSGG